MTGVWQSPDIEASYASGRLWAEGGRPMLATGAPRSQGRGGGLRCTLKRRHPSGQTAQRDGLDLQPLGVTAKNVVERRHALRACGFGTR